MMGGWPDGDKPERTNDLAIPILVGAVIGMLLALGTLLLIGAL